MTSARLRRLLTATLVAALAVSSVPRAALAHGAAGRSCCNRLTTGEAPSQAACHPVTVLRCCRGEPRPDVPIAPAHAPNVSEPPAQPLLPLAAAVLDVSPLGATRPVSIARHLVVPPLIYLLHAVLLV